MRIKISVLVVILLILSVNIVTAQLYKISLDQKPQNSTLIIEGKVIKSEAFPGHDAGPETSVGHIYTAHDIHAFTMKPKKSYCK